VEQQASQQLSVAEGPAAEQQPAAGEPGAAMGFAGEMGNAAFAQRVAGVDVALEKPAAAGAPEEPPAPQEAPPEGKPVLALKGKAEGKAGVSISPQIGPGGGKLTVEGSGQVEKGFSYIKLGAGLTITGEGEVQWSEADAPSVGPKAGKSTGGEKQKAVEADIPVWKSATEKEIQEGAETAAWDYLTPIQANLVVGGEQGSKPGETSTSASVGIKLKMKTGNELTIKVQLASLKSSSGQVVDIEGPLVAAEYEFPWNFGPKAVHTLKDGTPINLKAKVSVKPQVFVKPDYAAIGMRIAQSLLGRVATAAAPVAIPLAAAAVLGYGMYVGARNANAARRAAEDGVKARKDAEAACKNYAKTLLSGEAAGDDVGTKYGLADFKAIESESEGLIPREDLLDKIKETKGGQQKVAADNTTRIKDEMYRRAVAAFEEANKDDWSFWEEFGPDWGRRGVYRQTLRMVLYNDGS
jgi:hypothetical protein